MLWSWTGLPAAFPVMQNRPDNIVFDITPQPGQMSGNSASGWGHPICSAAATTIAGRPACRKKVRK